MRSSATSNARLVRAEVDLVEHDGLRSLLQPRSVRGELAVDGLEALGRVVLRRVDHVQEKVRALEVREELVAQPDTLARALDEAGYVGHGELARAVGRVDRAEDRRQVVNG